MPLENGSIDLSGVVTKPGVRAAHAQTDVQAARRFGIRWLSVCSQIASAVHGKRLPITLPDDPDHYYLGRIACTLGAKEYGAGTFEISPHVTRTNMRRPSAVSCGAGTTVIINNGDEIVSPTFTASAEGMTVALNGGAAYSIAQVGKAVKIPITAFAGRE